MNQLTEIRRRKEELTLRLKDAEQQHRDCATRCGCSPQGVDHTSHFTDEGFGGSETGEHRYKASMARVMVQLAYKEHDIYRKGYPSAFDLFVASRRQIKRT
jgi:hypothetical protein